MKYMGGQGGPSEQPDSNVNQATGATPAGGASPAVEAGRQDLPAIPEEGATSPAQAAAAERGSFGEAVAGPTATPAATPTAVETPPETVKGPEGELPDNRWSKKYYELKAQLEQNPAQRGSISNLLLALYLMAAKYAHFADLMPGHFMNTVTKDEDLLGKKLDPKNEANKEKIGKIVGSKGSEELAKKNLEKMMEADKAAGRKTSIERASTRYLTNLLWGIDDIDDAATLTATLLHTKKLTSEGEVALYNVGNFQNVRNQENIAKATILIFIPEPIKTGNKIVAYATGNKDEFEYFDPEKGKQEFNLRAPDAPITSDYRLCAILLPNTEAYDKAVELPPEVTESESAAALSEKLKHTEEIMTVLEKGNQEVKDQLDKLPKDTSTPKLEASLHAAKANEKAAQEAYDSVKTDIESIESRITEAADAEAAAKLKADATDHTLEDVDAYTKASGVSKKLLEEKKLLGRLTALLNTAKANASKIRELANPK